MSIPVYTDGAELPAITRDWRDDQDALINFATGWAFTARIGIPGETAVIEKTDGITGAATSPNLTIEWEPGELDDLTPGRWPLHVIATSDDGQRVLRMAIRKRAAIAATAS